ncbi:helix-turn-helix domain-containing protein [Orrella sp. JC864]|uniref:TetR/AcrR family transcriptional regulator n=1 Tax=Orrella sp. JC864 TaxID=3120298 RepID=UPI00300BC8F5
MGRPREFDEQAVLEAAMQCFWHKGYEATSVRDLIDCTGIAGASLYNAFGGKRALYERALAHYVQGTIAARIGRCAKLPPVQAIGAFFDDILRRSLQDRDRKGCMLVNAALGAAPRDPALQAAVADELARIEAFFLSCVQAGQAQGAIDSRQPAQDLARHLLSVLMGLRVLARVRPDRALLEGAAGAALAALAPAPAPAARVRRTGR